MKSRVLRIIIKAVILVLIFIALSFLANLIFNKILNALEDVDVTTQNRLKLLKFIVTAVVTFITSKGLDLLRIYVDRKEPKLYFSAKEVLGIYRTKIYRYNPEVVLGQGNYYTYIETCIRNDGERRIMKCSVNNTALSFDGIAEGEDFKLFLRICSTSAENVLTTQKLKIRFEDSRYYNYKLTLRIKFDVNNLTVDTDVIRKQRRSIV